MQNIKQIISGVITSKPDVFQFTKDRKFEEAWIIYKNDARPSETDVELYLLKEKFETLIVEYVWYSTDDDKRFVLTIFLDKNCALQAPAKFVDISLDSFYQYASFSALIDVFNKKVIGHEYLLAYPVESINISVFNHWLSVGPVELWKTGETYDNDKTVSIIKSRPEIEKSKLNYQGLFFRFNVSGQYNGPYYGIKTPCCARVGDEWVIDFVKVDYWMKALLNLNP
jgi:hypothetical protein